MKLAKVALATGVAMGARQAMKELQRFSVDDLLCGVGLERRRSSIDKIIPALGWLGLGAAAGAAAALLYAPSSGKELREGMSKKLGEAKEEVRGKVEREIRSLENRVHESISGHRPEEASRGNGS